MRSARGPAANPFRIAPASAFAELQLQDPTPTNPKSNPNPKNSKGLAIGVLDVGVGFGVCWSWVLELEFGEPAYFIRDSIAASALSISSSADFTSAESSYFPATF